ncbi:MAG: glutamate racemase [Pseudomonadales bacterium]
MTDPSPIGVFDSGMGGLTVLRALRCALPGESFLYLGDTARLPYGTKSPATVERYALQAASILVARGIKALVVACNTASAIALDALARRYAPLPVFGVLAPGAEAAARHAGARMLVLATESTVRGGAYQHALLQLRPDLQVLARPCPLLVALAEEGLHDGEIVELALRRYLAGLDGGRHGQAVSALLLGCTHFPVFRGAIGDFLAARGRSDVAIVDSAQTTAAVVAAAIAAGRMAAAPGNGEAHVTLLATDGPERFGRVGGYFLGQPVRAVELVDL